MDTTSTEASTAPDTGTDPDVGALRVSVEQVAADPMLREAARSFADLYLVSTTLTDWLAGSDWTPHARREFVADLIDADHTLDPDPHDDRNPWLIDRPWRGLPDPSRTL